MKGIINIVAVFLANFLILAVSYDDGESFCVIFPQNGRDIFGVAQRSILIFREDEVSLIPQVHFEGDARDFGILVPVPAEPRLSTVGANIFTEASFLTQPIIRQSNQGCGCDDSVCRITRKILQLCCQDAYVPRHRDLLDSQLQDPLAPTSGRLSQ